MIHVLVTFLTLIYGFAILLYVIVLCMSSFIIVAYVIYTTLHTPFGVKGEIL